jgi:hypothetical protein
MAAVFVYRVARDRPQHVVLRLRRLGDKLGLASDSDGSQSPLASLKAVFVAAAALAFTAQPTLSTEPKGLWGSQRTKKQEKVC